MKTKLIILTLWAFAFQANAQSLFTTEVKGHGQPMILIHGLYCSGEVWNETVAHYQSRYECHILTLAGFGGNAPKLSDHFLEQVKDEVVAYAKKLHKPVLMGHSMGGFIAFWAAASSPGTFSKIIAVDGLPFLPEIQIPGSTVESSKPMAAMMKGQMEKQTPDQVEAAQKQYLPMMMTSQARIDQVAKIAVKCDPATQAEVMYELYTIDLRKTVATIDCPVMLMGAWIAYKNYGATHASVEKIEKEETAGIANCTIEITDTAKHFIFYDDQPWFEAKVDAFLAK